MSGLATRKHGIMIRLKDTPTSGAQIDVGKLFLGIVARGLEGFASQKHPLSAVGGRCTKEAVYGITAAHSVLQLHVRANPSQRGQGSGAPPVVRKRRGV